MYKQFQDIGDHALQNQFIQRHIKIKSIAKRLWEEEIVEKKIQRRVTCKYLIPMTGSVMDSYSCKCCHCSKRILIVQSTHNMLNSCERNQF